MLYLLTNFYFHLLTSLKASINNKNKIKNVVRYFELLRRYNYTTPTSYLELILTFKKLITAKRNEILMLKNRYLTGLEKLAFAQSQVSVMQTELQQLQPELVKTQELTAKLMIKIEQDTVEVEAKKEVNSLLHLHCIKLAILCVVPDYIYIASLRANRSMRLLLS